MTKDMKQLLVVGGILGVTVYLLSKTKGPKLSGLSDAASDQAAYNAIEARLNDPYWIWKDSIGPNPYVGSGYYYNMISAEYNTYLRDRYGDHPGRARACMSKGRIWNKANQKCDGPEPGLSPLDRSHPAARAACLFYNDIWDPRIGTCTSRTSGKVTYAGSKHTATANNGPTSLKRRR